MSYWLIYNTRSLGPHIFNRLHKSRSFSINLCLFTHNFIMCGLIETFFFCLKGCLSVIVPCKFHVIPQDLNVILCLWSFSLFGRVIATWNVKRQCFTGDGDEADDVLQSWISNWHMSVTSTWCSELEHDGDLRNSVKSKCRHVVLTNFFLYGIR